MTIRTLTAALLLQAALSLSATAATFIPLDPKATYLHTNQDSPTPPAALALRLADYGWQPGDSLQLQVVGDVDNGPGGDSFTFTLGVFSSSNLLLGHDQVNRVAGALASDGPAVLTSPTYFGAQATDIPQDFGFDKPGGVVVTVPDGAAYLFLAKSDQLYHDNSDPDHDYGVLIALAPVPEPASAALLLSGMALIGVLRHRRAAA
jgi:hypothetical protein